MSILLCIGTILFAYGTYHLLCYFLMLPTVRMDRHMRSVGKSGKITYLDNVSILLAEKLVTRWNLDWNKEEQMERYLRDRAIDIDGTAYCISQVIKLAVGIIILIPIAFLNMYLPFYLILLWLLCCSRKLKFVFGAGKKVNFPEFKRLKKYFMSIFLCIYGILNILLIAKLFT